MGHGRIRPKSARSQPRSHTWLHRRRRMATQCPHHRHARRPSSCSPDARLLAKYPARRITGHNTGTRAPSKPHSFRTLTSITVIVILASLNRPGRTSDRLNSSETGEAGTNGLFPCRNHKGLAPVRPGPFRFLSPSPKQPLYCLSNKELRRLVSYRTPSNFYVPSCVSISLSRSMYVCHLVMSNVVCM